MVKIEVPPLYQVRPQITLNKCKNKPLQSIDTLWFAINCSNSKILNSFIANTRLVHTMESHYIQLIAWICSLDSTCLEI